MNKIDFNEVVKKYGSTINDVIEQIGDSEALEFYSKDKVAFLKVADYAYPILSGLSQFIKNDTVKELDFNCHFLVEALLTSKLNNPKTVSKYSTSVLNVITSVILRFETQDFPLDKRLAFMKFGGEFMKSIGNTINSMMYEDEEIQDDEEVDESLSNFSNSILLLDDGIKLLIEKYLSFDAAKIYTLDPKTFLYIADYCYPTVLRFTNAIKKGNQGNSVDVTIELEDIIQSFASSKVYESSKVPEYTKLILDTALTLVLKTQTKDLKIEQRAYLIEQIEALGKSLEESLKEILTDTSKPEETTLKTKSKPFNSVCLEWFEQFEDPRIELIALKTVANNMFEQDSKNNFVIYNKHLDQLGEVGKSEFGKAMFYVGFGLNVVIQKGGIETIPPVLDGFKAIADRLAEQPDNEEQFKYLKIPFIIMTQNHDDVRTEEFNDKINEILLYIRNAYSGVTEDMQEMMNSLEKLTEGLTQMEGLDQDKVAKLLKELTRDKKQFGM